MKNALPDAEITQLGVNQGSGSPGLVAGVDQLQINNTTYDFENPLPTADLAIRVDAAGPRHAGLDLPGDRDGHEHGQCRPPATSARRS